MFFLVFRGLGNQRVDVATECVSIFWSSIARGKKNNSFLWGSKKIAFVLILSSGVNIFSRKFELA
jgi:hypothetical protein